MAEVTCLFLLILCQFFATFDDFSKFYSVRLQRTPVFKKCQKFGKNLKKTLVQKLMNESRLLIHNGFVKRRQVNSAYGYKQVLYMYMVWLKVLRKVLTDLCFEKLRGHLKI